MTLFRGAGDARYLIVSNHGVDSYAVYRREPGKTRSSACSTAALGPEATDDPRPTLLAATSIELRRNVARADYPEVQWADRFSASAITDGQNRNRTQHRLAAAAGHRIEDLGSVDPAKPAECLAKADVGRHPLHTFASPSKAPLSGTCREEAPSSLKPLQFVRPSVLEGHAGVTRQNGDRLGDEGLAGLRQAEHPGRLVNRHAPDRVLD